MTVFFARNHTQRATLHATIGFANSNRTPAIYSIPITRSTTLHQASPGRQSSSDHCGLLLAAFVCSSGHAKPEVLSVLRMTAEERDVGQFGVRTWH
jgi:hypothetical protein